jgi:hypothetical protein
MDGCTRRYFFATPRIFVAILYSSAATSGAFGEVEEAVQVGKGLLDVTDLWKHGYYEVRSTSH